MKKITGITTILLLFLISSCNEVQKETNGMADNKEAEMKTTVEQFITKGWNQKDTAFIKEHLTDNFVRAVNGVNVANNKNEMGTAMYAFYNLYPDLALKGKMASTSGNRTTVEWSFTGTYALDPAKGKNVNVSGVSLLTWDDKSKLSREDVFFNELDMMKQLGYTLTAPAVPK